MYLVNYKEYSEFVGGMLVRPGITKLSRAKAKEIEKGALPSGLALCESLDGVQWDSFPLGVKQAYAQDERYRVYLGAGEEIDQSEELRSAIEVMNKAAMSGLRGDAARAGGEDDGPGSE